MSFKRKKKGAQLNIRPPANLRASRDSGWDQLLSNTWLTLHMFSSGDLHWLTRTREPHLLSAHTQRNTHLPLFLCVQLVCATASALRRHEAEGTLVKLRSAGTHHVPLRFSTTSTQSRQSQLRPASHWHRLVYLFSLLGLQKTVFRVGRFGIRINQPRMWAMRPHSSDSLPLPFLPLLPFPSSTASNKELNCSKLPLKPQIY